MPISIEEFECHEPEDVMTEPVVRFLARNSDKAYTAVEIAEKTRVSESSIYPVLNRLENRGQVRHREPYWAIGDAETGNEAVRLSATAGYLNDRFGPESRQEWLRAAKEGEMDE